MCTGWGHYMKSAHTCMLWMQNMGIHNDMHRHSKCKIQWNVHFWERKIKGYRWQDGCVWDVWFLTKHLLLFCWVTRWWVHGRCVLLCNYPLSHLWNSIYGHTGVNLCVSHICVSHLPWCEDGWPGNHPGQSAGRSGPENLELNFIH